MSGGRKYRFELIDLTSSSDSDSTDGKIDIENNVEDKKDVEEENDAQLFLDFLKKIHEKQEQEVQQVQEAHTAKPNKKRKAQHLSKTASKKSKAKKPVIEESESDYVQVVDESESDDCVNVNTSESEYVQVNKDDSESNRTNKRATGCLHKSGQLADNTKNLNHEEESSDTSDVQECLVECRLCERRADYFTRHSRCGAFLDICVYCAKNDDQINNECCMICSLNVCQDTYKTPAITFVRDQYKFCENFDKRQLGEFTKTCVHCHQNCSLYVRHAKSSCGAIAGCCVECAADWCKSAICGGCGSYVRGTWVAANHLDVAKRVRGKRKAVLKSQCKTVSRSNKAKTFKTAWPIWSTSNSSTHLSRKSKRNSKRTVKV